MTHTGSKFHIEDFQIVNGCQTTHVLHDQRDDLDDSVLVPLRLIWTQDEEVIQDIIHATNKQTEIKSEQFFAVTEFARGLEAFFFRVIPTTSVSIMSAVPANTIGYRPSSGPE